MAPEPLQQTGPRTLGGGRRSEFWITTLTGVRQSEARWGEIAHYLEPVRRYLGWRYPRLPAPERDDIAQSVLLDMHQRLVARYDPAIGRFRTFLQAAIRHKVIDWFRQHGRVATESVLGIDLDTQHAEIGEEDARAVDLEAELLRAICAFHDRFTFGSENDRDVVRCFGFRILSAMGEREIAARMGLTRDQVKERLRTARHHILCSLARSTLAREQSDACDRACDRVAHLVRRGVRGPGRRAELLGAERDPRTRAAAEQLLASIDAARRHFLGLQTEAGREFLRALEDVFEPA